ncbi:LRR receptor-like serine/threonine-protein kinase EFR isoform X2 [Triticum urartu]|uniref:LRR receptor-like serine/threonine-protein kinase EFR isoform X2 n=1 Tax=Triticum urartu TaxID=4572 RepID=UPI002043E220|nr:LRR receptor-like serine/threonine-protein kinase EFR isoform X2 [Triticum urartu]
MHPAFQPPTQLTGFTAGRPQSPAGGGKTMQERLSFRAIRPSKGDMAISQAARLATMLMLLPLLLISCGVGSILCSSMTTVHDNSTDMISLLDFKRAITNNSRQALRSWHASVPLCSWEGVHCSSGRVTKLYLSDRGLLGRISPSLGNLTFLRTLDLSQNGFTGELPPLNRLHRLEYLDLGHNSLQGTIPDTLTNCSKLRILDLSANLLMGEIPLGTGRLSNLRKIWLSSNNLTGAIPPSLKNNSQLEDIVLTENKLMGTIPDEMGIFPSLVNLDLAGNMLSVPSNFGDTLLSLKHLCLDNNNFEGHLPASLGNISELRLLNLSSNNFIGQVPGSFGNLALLEYLILQRNNFWGFIPIELGDLKQLTHLDLSDNNLQGGVP